MLRFVFLKMKEIDIERAAQAEANFRAGYNCAQSVYMAYADLFELDSTLAATISAPFGGGMGRLRSVRCLQRYVFGGRLAVPVATPKDREAKVATISWCKSWRRNFKAENGSVYLSRTARTYSHTDSPIPEARTETYYKTPVCPIGAHCG